MGCWRREAAQALLDLPGDDPAAVLGSIDALKVRSSMTLFELVSGAPEFPAVLERYYHGQRDDLTLEIVREFPVHNVLFLDFVVSCSQIMRKAIRCHRKNSPL